MINEIKEVNGIGVTKNLIGINYTKGMFIKPKFIVVHDITDSRFDTMREFRNYIAHDKEAKISVHYLVGARAVVKILEDEWRGWHVGDKPTKDITNSNSISVAMFIRDNKDIGRVIKNTVDLVNKLREKFNIPVKNVKRHYDVTGRRCPEILINKESWNRFVLALKGVQEDLIPIGKGKIIGILSKLNLKKGPNDESEVLGVVNANDEFFIYKEMGNWVKTSIEDDNSVLIGYLNKDYLEITPIREAKPKPITEVGEKIRIKDESQVETKKVFKEVTETDTFKVKVSEGLIESTIKKTTNEILEEVKVKPTKSELPTIIRTINRSGIVYNVDTNLNVRRGPGEENYVVGYLLAGQKIFVEQEVGEWYKIIYQSTIGKRSGYVEKEFVKLT